MIPTRDVDDIFFVAELYALLVDVCFYDAGDTRFERLHHYAYDDNSNRAFKRVCTFNTPCDEQNPCSSGVDEDGTYDDQDRMVTYGTASYAYRADGSLLTKTVGNDVTAYHYDAYGNLKEVELPNGWAIRYTVDGRNRRVARRVYDDQEVLQDERRWLWQGQLRIVAELDGNDAVTKRFVYGTKVNVPEYVITYSSGSPTGTYRLITDQLGSLRLVVNTANGSIAQRMQHDEWGNVLEDFGSGFTPFGFAGGLYDPATDLTRFGARDYDSETGRWTGKDPIGFSGLSINLLEYSTSDPGNTLDPFGLFSAICWGPVAAGGGDSSIKSNPLVDHFWLVYTMGGGLKAKGFQPRPATTGGRWLSENPRREGNCILFDTDSEEDKCIDDSTQGNGVYMLVRSDCRTYAKQVLMGCLKNPFAALFVFTQIF
jgi:RHS repeat-associated protein